jgi:hypothetical protein
MRISIQEYLEGIAALEDFIALLQEALQNTMPEAGLLRTAGQGWRGFLIEEAEGLADGEYACQMYLKDPSTLVFQENIPVSGGLKHPFRVDLDLDACGFFFASQEAQLERLAGFIQQAVQEARRWHRSERRKGRLGGSPRRIS